MLLVQAQSSFSRKSIPRQIIDHARARQRLLATRPFLRAINQSVSPAESPHRDFRGAQFTTNILAWRDVASERSSLKHSGAFLKGGGGVAGVSLSAGGGLLRLLADTVRRGGERRALPRYAFISSTSSSPRRSAGWSAGLPSARTRRWAAEGGGRLVGAVGWAGRRGRYRFHPAWRGETRSPPPLSFPRPLPSSSPPCNPRTPGHRVKAHGRRLTVASSKWVSRGWCASVRTCFSNTCAHVRARRFALLLPRCHGINSSSMLRRHIVT